MYVLQGTITDHREGIAADYGPGPGWPEDRNTLHWLENRGSVTAVEVSVDVIRSPLGLHDVFVLATARAGRTPAGGAEP